MQMFRNPEYFPNRDLSLNYSSKFIVLYIALEM